ncbi:hypothetical protein ATCC90586_010811 [Pythium insidiosum]|nr:hypothetical protein ATCC90586_010811 [Pythium insidiosum]
MNPNPSFETDIYNFTPSDDDDSYGDWNLLGPSTETLDPVNADGSEDITSAEIYAYLLGIKDQAELEYAITMYKYRRTIKCVTAGLQTLAKSSVTSSEYHALVKWMYEHCATDGRTPEPTKAPLPDVPTASPVAPLDGDSSSHIDRTYMTKLEFYYMIKNHFMNERETMFGQAQAARLRAGVAAESNQKLLACIEAASEQFGHERVR